MVFIHDNGILHLDLKPPKIGDFGMASVWPRSAGEGFERERDKEYMTPLVDQISYALLREWNTNAPD